MEAKSWMMLKVLINRFNPKAGNALQKFLPQEDLTNLTNFNIQSTDFLPLLYEPLRLIQQMHYSWIQALLDKMPSHLYPYILGSLSTKQSSRLGKILSVIPTTPSKPVQAFFINKLFSLAKPKNHLPIEYLPETELSPLAKWNKKDLTQLIDFLGLYDLASEVRRIVDKRYLDNLYSCLTPAQLSYLRICLYQKDKLVSPKLGINPSEKNCEKLKSILHLRGIARLGKGLSGENTDLLWYLTHTLDIGRGKLLMNFYKTEAIPNITNLLKSQILNIMNFIKKSKS